MKLLYKIKYLIDRLFLKKKIHKLGKKAYIRRKYIILGGKYISIGDNVSIREGASIQCFYKYADRILSPTLMIGNNVFINRYVSIICADSITIGDNCYFGSFVTICDENHGTDPRSTECYGKQPLVTEAICIGANCWIGDKSTILRGVSIGPNSIVGAGSVVTKSIPNHSIVAGNPARVIKRWNDQKNTWEKINEEKCIR